MELKNGKYTFDEFVDIIAKLRSPEGCPWDREQTHESIRNSAIEEAYELVEAINNGKADKIADESGDVLLQVVLHAQIGKDNGEYDISDVIDMISRKMIHRHPHVFGNVTVKDSGEVLDNWDAIKRNDRSQESITDDLKGVSKFIPSLLRAKKVCKKAKKAGFNPNVEKTELKSEEEYGKKLFDLAISAGESGIDPEVALTSYIEKFIKDFESYEKEM